MDRIEWSESHLKDRVFIEGDTDCMGSFFIKEQDGKFEAITPSLDAETLDTLDEAKEHCEKLFQDKLMAELNRRFAY